MPTPKKSATQKAKPVSHPAEASGPQDADKLLMADHKKVKALFGQYKKLVEGDAEAGDRKALAEQICGMLTVHATIEEEIFYPAAREALEEQDLLDEAEVEHASAKDLIAQLDSMDADDELYDAKVTVLGEYIDHHVKEEEEEMFPKCRKSEMDLAELGVELDERRTELMSEAGLAAEV